MKALDLFCGGGGVCLGLQACGFDVVGVDIKKRKHYPGTFIQGDIFDLPVSVHDFDLVWASPPCQRYSVATFSQKKEHILSHPDLVPVTRWLLAGHPYTVVENVRDAPIRHDITLTGPKVHLKYLERVRHFEVSFWRDCWFDHPAPRLDSALFKSGDAVTITTSMSSNYNDRIANKKVGRIKKLESKEKMGIPDDARMTNEEIGNSVPPPYAEYIGRIAYELIADRGVYPSQKVWREHRKYIKPLPIPKDKGDELTFVDHDQMALF